MLQSAETFSSLSGEKVKSRYFRERAAFDLQAQFPQIGEDYRRGLLPREIEEKYSFCDHFNWKPGKNVYSAITMAVGGFTDLNGRDVNGIIEKTIYNQIALDNRANLSKRAGELTRISDMGNAVRAKKLGLEPWTDGEKYQIWLANYDDTFVDKRGYTRRGELTAELNSKFHNDRAESHVRNVLNTVRVKRREVDSVATQINSLFAKYFE